MVGNEEYKDYLVVNDNQIGMAILTTDLKEIHIEKEGEKMCFWGVYFGRGAKSSRKA